MDHSTPPIPHATEVSAEMIAASITDNLLLTAAITLALIAIGNFALMLYRWAKTIDTSLDYIKHEMELNSGKTMRDAIARIEKKQAEIEAHLKQQDDQA